GLEASEFLTSSRCAFYMNQVGFGYWRAMLFLLQGRALLDRHGSDLYRPAGLGRDKRHEPRAHRQALFLQTALVRCLLRYNPKNESVQEQIGRAAQMCVSWSCHRL